MNITEDQKSALASSIQSWLKEKGILDEDTDVVVGLQFVPRKPQVVIHVGRPPEPDVEKILDMPVSSLELPTMGENALSVAGIRTIRDIVLRVKRKGDARNLLSIQHFGVTTYKRVLLRLQELGLRLGPEWRWVGANSSWKPSKDPNV